jgi:HAD superfamily hydrolase (TIGR01456 family)
MRRLCKTSLAFALDIDGVFLKGKNVIPGARDALSILEDSRMPYIFVTNGGGMTEIEKARSLSELLDVNIEEGQVLMSHTPFRSEVEKYEDKRVLVLGSDSCIDIANHYGFRRAVSARQLLRETPTAFKQIDSDSTSLAAVENVCTRGGPVHAAFIIGDPYEWGLEMQILADQMMMSHCESQEQIPLFASNADIVYNNEHPLPRFTQGAFVTAFQHLYNASAAAPNSRVPLLDVTFCGKPYTITYRKAETMLQDRARVLGVDMPGQIVGVGDSPHSDIRGANNHGWTSVLLKTGVWAPADTDAATATEVWDSDPSMRPDHVYGDILEAIQVMLR